MITLTEKKTEEIGSFCKSDIFGIRILAYLNAYDLGQRFLTFWEQRDENGEVTAVISSLEGDTTLCLSEEADFSELNEFLAVVGCKTVFFNAKYSNKIKYKVDETGKVLKLSKKLSSPSNITKDVDFKELFSLIFEDEKTVDFGTWFTDLSHKLRHDAASLVAIKNDEKIVACAISVYETEKAAVIGSVMVRQELRRQGLGSKVVMALSSELQQKGKDVFLCRENDKNEEFYDRLGFETVGEWMMVGI